MATELPEIAPGTIVTAKDWWNPLTRQVNHNSDDIGDLQQLSSETQVDVNDLLDRTTTINNRLGSGIGTSNDGTTEQGTAGAQLAYLRENIHNGGDSFPAAYVKLIQSGPQTMASSANVTITNWIVSGSQEGGLFTPGSNALTIPATGFYLFTATLMYSGARTQGQRVLYVNQDKPNPASNGANVLGSALLPAVSSTIASGQCVPLSLSCGAQLSKNTPVYLVSWQDSGAGLATATGYGGQTVFSAVRMA